jgi:hypothetical protein
VEFLKSIQQNEIFYCYCGGKEMNAFNKKYSIVEKINQLLEKKHTPVLP